MAEPLDYHNPLRKKLADESGDNESRTTASVSKAIPIEFDTLLTQTEDHAAIRAIQSALAQVKIDCFIASNGTVAQRLVEVHIRATDHEKAAPIAAEIFVRRKKLKSYPRPKMPDLPKPSGNGISEW